MFFDKIKEICEKNEKVAMFIDMDGTILEYRIFGGEDQVIHAHEQLMNEKPITPIIDVLKEINKIENVDLYILSLAKTTKIVEEKKVWLNKYVDFIKKENWILIDKEKGEYNSENRNIKKSEKMKEKLAEYNFVILLDDDHKILKETNKELGDKVKVFHISSALI